MRKSLVVIGGGAAGFFGAVNAARLNPHLSVTILEKSREVLSKVRISGGGRCNVTYHCFDNELLARAYPRGGKELRWAFEQFDAADTVQWFSERSVPLKTEDDGRMFPVTDDSATIINSLKEEAKKCGVSIRTKTKAASITPNRDGTFDIEIAKSKPLHADMVLVATGGYNRLNAYSWLQKLGHAIETPVPSLFTFNFREKVLADLAGISIPNVSIAIKGSPYEYAGPLLITHWGLSGPAVLKTSAWAARYLYEQEYRFDAQVNWVHPKAEGATQKTLKQLREKNARKLVVHQDWFELPARLWKRLVVLAGISPKKRWASLSNEDLHNLVHQLVQGTYSIQGKTTYKEEFVTCGGIPLNEVDWANMQSKRCPGLYFAGEVLDIDGITGGYNFQSAWTTGWIAAKDIAKNY